MKMWRAQLQLQSQTQTSKAFPMANLVVRVITFTALLVSLIIIAANTATIKGEDYKVTIRFKHIYAYRYMVSTIVLGFAYTILQIPFAIHHVRSGKRLMKHDGLLNFDLFGDKVLLSLLATGVGAAFGATVDLKKNLDELDDALLEQDITRLSVIRSKLDTFFNMALLSTGFLLIAFLSSGVSSVQSSLALTRKNKGPERSFETLDTMSQGSC